MLDRDKTFVVAQAQELASARHNFPSPNCSTIALMEEVGELAKALLDESWDRVVEEAVQVAVMAQRVATEGDPSTFQYRVNPTSKRKALTSTL